MPHPRTKIHRMFELVEPIGTVTFSDVPNEAFLAYDVLSAGELDELIAGLEPIAAAVQALDH